VKEIIADGGRVIRVYDNVFDFEYRQRIYEFVRNSLFRIGWADGNIVENQHHKFMHSIYSTQDLEQLEYLKHLHKHVVGEETQTYDLVHAVVNLSTPSDVNFVHAHPEDKVILYYANLEWRDGWHGETLFYSDDQKEVVFASPYTPGRVIVFDAKIPHTIRPQSHLAAFYRFTLALLYKKNVDSIR